MNRVIRVGVVGVGVMGERHARVYSEMPETDLVGIFDPDLGRAYEIANRYGTQVLPLDELLEQVTGLSIASPTSTHAEVALRALEAGCHVLVEKPLAGTLEEAGILRAAALKRGRQVFMVGHIERFNPTIIALQELIEGQDIRGLRFTRTSPFDRRSLDSDIVYDLMIHDIDLALELLGEDIESIDATGAVVVSDRIDHAEADLRMKGDLPVSFVASRVAADKVRAVAVRIDSATIDVDLLGKAISIDYDSPIKAALTAPAIGAQEPLRLELEHFIHSVTLGGRPVVGIEAGYRSMVMATTITSLIQRSIAAHAEPRLVPAAAD